MNEELKYRSIVEGCLKKKRKEQEQLYRIFAPKMYSICKHYSESRDEAMDFLQEGFISVFKSISNYHFRGSLEGWIKRIIVRRCIDGVRKRSKYKETLLDFDIPAEEEEIELESSTENIEKIKKLIDSLPPKAALILKLFVLEGYGHKEISGMLNISEGTSKSQLNRAKSLIRQNLSS